MQHNFENKTTGETSSDTNEITPEMRTFVRRVLEKTLEHRGENDDNVTSEYYAEVEKIVNNSPEQSLEAHEN